MNLKNKPLIKEHGAITKKKVLALLLTIMLATSMFYILVASNGGGATYITSGSFTEDYSYLITWKNGTHIQVKNGTTGTVDIESTNASYVCEQVWGDDRLIHFKAGTFSIDYDVLSTYQNFIVEGEGAGNTILELGQGGGFTLSKGIGSSFRENIQFRHLTIDGQGLDGQYGIRSRSDAGGGSGNVILRNFGVIDVVFKGFNGTGSISLDLVNLEEALFDKVILFGTTGVNMYLWSDGTYESGNIRIKNSWICTGYGTVNDTVGILVNSTGTDPLGDHGCGGLWVSETHFLGQGVDSPYHSVAVKLVSDNASCSHNKIINNRMEGCDIVHSVSSASYVSKYNVIADNNCVNNKGVQIWLDQFTRNGEVHGNTISNSNSSSYCIIDDASLYTSSENKIYNNFLFSPAQVRLTPYTIVYDNYKLNPLGVKSTNYRYGDSMSYYGTASNWANETIYTVRNTNMLLTLTGGSDINVTIWDINDNLVATNITSANAKLIPHLYQFSINCTSTPTSTFAWI